MQGKGGNYQQFFFPSTVGSEYLHARIRIARIDDVPITKGASKSGSLVTLDLSRDRGIFPKQ